MREREQWRAEPLDDVDRLFGRLEPVAPPRDLAPRILAHTSRRTRLPWRLWVALTAVVGLAAILLAAVSGYLTGQALVRSGAYELLRLALEDWDLVRAAPGEYMLALAEAVPWGSLLATIACVVAAYAVTRPLARATDRLTSRARGSA